MCLSDYLRELEEKRMRRNITDDTPVTVREDGVVMQGILLGEWPTFREMDDAEKVWMIDELSNHGHCELSTFDDPTETVYVVEVS